MDISLPTIADDQEQLVKDLKNGKDTSEQIIMSHLRLVMSIVAPIASRHPQHRADLESEALLATTRAVNRVKRAEYQLYDNNITPYISGCVKPALKRYIAKTHMIPIPSETISYNRRNGIQTTFDRVMVTDVVCASKKHEVSLEVLELVEMCITNNAECKVVKMRLQGYTFDEISQELGFMNESRSRQIFNLFRHRFRYLWEK